MILICIKRFGYAFHIHDLQLWILILRKKCFESMKNNKTIKEEEIRYHQYQCMITLPFEENVVYTYQMYINILRLFLFQGRMWLDLSLNLLLRCLQRLHLVLDGQTVITISPFTMETPLTYVKKFNLGFIVTQISLEATKNKLLQF